MHVTLRTYVYEEGNHPFLCSSLCRRKYNTVVCVCYPVLYTSSALYRSVCCTNMYCGFRSRICCSCVSNPCCWNVFIQKVSQQFILCLFNMFLIIPFYCVWLHIRVCYLEYASRRTIFYCYSRCASGVRRIWSGVAISFSYVRVVTWSACCFVNSASLEFFLRLLHVL